MNTKAKIFIGVGIAIFVAGIAYFTKDKWLPLFKGKGDGETPPPDAGSNTDSTNTNTGGGSTNTSTSTKPKVTPPKDAGQVGAKPTGNIATISVYGVETALWQNIEDVTALTKSAIIKYRMGSAGLVLGEVINQANDKNGTKYYYLKLSTKVLKDGKTYWNGWVNSRLVSVK